MIDRIWPKSENDPIEFRTDPPISFSLYNSKDEFVFHISSYYEYLNVRRQIAEKGLEGYYILTYSNKLTIDKYGCTDHDPFDYIDRELGDLVKAQMRARIKDRDSYTEITLNR